MPTGSRARVFRVWPGDKTRYLPTSVLPDRLERRDGAGDEGRLLLEHGVVDRAAEAFVQDFDAEELRGSSSSVFVGGGDRDVEGQDLIGVPGGSDLLEAGNRGQWNLVQLVSGGVHGHGNIAGERRVECAHRVRGQAGRALELGTDIVCVRKERTGMVDD